MVAQPSPAPLLYISEEMPHDDPGSLSAAQNQAVTAWLLEQNGYRLGIEPDTADGLGLDGE